MFKVFIPSTPVTTAARFLPQIMKGITDMPDDCKRHCRQKTKFLMERFSRKFGFDLVASLVPKSDVTTQKRLRNIRKEVARRARKVSEDGSGGDEDDQGMKGRQKTMDEMLADSSDDEFDDKEEIKNKRGGKKGGTWIQEGDEILDLLSASAAQKISSTKPTQAKVKMEDETKKKARKSDFKISADGKIIITEKSGKDEDDEDDGPRRGNDE